MKVVSVPLMVMVVLVGLALGSFLNVIIYRLPRQQSLIFPRSHCPSCGRTLTALELVPVLSFLFLRGRCRTCNQPISWRYPLVELAAALVVTVMVMRWGLSLVALQLSLLALGLIAITAIDLEHQVIPDELNFFLFLAGIILTSWRAGGGNYKILTTAAAGALAGGFFLLLIALLSRGGMGGGDVKLAFVLGWYCGWPLVLVALFVAFVSGGLVGAILLLSGRKKGKDALPFAPYLAAGALVAIGVGEKLWYWYAGGWL